MSVLYDVIFAAGFVFIVVRGWRRGILATLLGLLGWAAAAVVIATFSEGWSQSIYHRLVEPWAVRSVEAAIPADAVAAMNSTAEAVRSVQATLDQLTGLLGGQVVNTASVQAIESLLSQNGGSLARTITQVVLQPMLLNMIHGVLSLVILMVCLFIFRLLSRWSRRGRGGGILGRMNRLLGGALGIAEGIAVGYLYSQALWTLANAVTADWLTADMLKGTLLVGLFL